MLTPVEESAQRFGPWAAYSGTATRSAAWLMGNGHGGLNRHRCNGEFSMIFRLATMEHLAILLIWCQFSMIYQHTWSIWKSCQHHRPTLSQMAVNVIYGGWFKKCEERFSFSQVQSTKTNIDSIDYLPIKHGDFPPVLVPCLSPEGSQQSRVQGCQGRSSAGTNLVAVQRRQRSTAALSDSEDTENPTQIPGICEVDCYWKWHGKAENTFGYIWYYLIRLY